MHEIPGFEGSVVRERGVVMRDRGVVVVLLHRPGIVYGTSLHAGFVDVWQARINPQGNFRALPAIDSAGPFKQSSQHT